jgi:hypothetical protein
MKLTWLVAAAAIPRIAFAQPAPDQPAPDPAPVPVPATATAPAPQQPDRDYEGAVYTVPSRQKDIVITSAPDRSSNNKILLASLAGAAVVFGGVGLYYNLDAKSASDQVSAKNVKNTIWTAADQATFDRANSSSTKAEVFYGIGGALLVGAAITFIVTAPKTETTVIHSRTVTPTASPTPGGAMLGGAWSF